MISLIENGPRIVTRLSEKDDILCYHIESGLVHRIKGIAKKSPRKTPYRLRTKNFLLDTYLTNTFLIRKPDGKRVFRRLCDIRDDFKFCLYDEKTSLFKEEKFISLLQDWAHMRMYSISTEDCTVKDKTIIANGFIMKPEK